MSRRSGLGRGLAALIPPSDSQRDTPDTPAQQDDAVTADTPADPSESASTSIDDTPPPSPIPTSVSSADDVAADDDAPSAATAPGTADAAVANDSTAGNASDDAVHTDVSDAADVEGASPAPESGVQATTATLIELAPDQIVTNPRQPRDVFDPDEIEGLAVSLQEMGVLQPLVVRHRSDGAYELIAGERRLRAAKIAGLGVVPVMVRHTDDGDLLKEALVENIHRVQLNPLEEGAAYQQLLEEFGATKEELAARLGKSRPAISNAIRLLQLPPAVQRRVAAGVLSAGHAKALLSLENPRTQADIADRIVAEGLSVRATEELVRLRSDAPAAPSRKRRPPNAPGLIELQQDLSDALMARVKINMGASKGRVAIEFSTVDDLERIVGVIANGLGAKDSLGRSPQLDATPGTNPSVQDADERGI